MARCFFDVSGPELLALGQLRVELATADAARPEAVDLLPESARGNLWPATAQELSVRVRNAGRNPVFRATLALRFERLA